MSLSCIKSYISKLYHKESGDERMKLFECIVDDGRVVFKSMLAAEDEETLLEIYGGNGEFVRIKDVTDDYLTEGSPHLLAENLRTIGWGEAEIALIVALLRRHIDTR